MPPLTQLLKKRKGLSSSLMGLMVSCALFFLPTGFEMTLFPVGWVGIILSLSGIGFFAVQLLRNADLPRWLAVLPILAIVEMLIFIRITCIPMSLTAFGPWQLMFVVFGWTLLPLIAAGAWCFRLAGHVD